MSQKVWLKKVAHGGDLWPLLDNDNNKKVTCTRFRGTTWLVRSKIYRDVLKCVLCYLICWNPESVCGLFTKNYWMRCVERNLTKFQQFTDIACKRWCDIDRLQCFPCRVRIPFTSFAFVKRRFGSPQKLHSMRLFFTIFFDGENTSIMITKYSRSPKNIIN